MAKKKKSKPLSSFSQSTWIVALFIGITIGVASQRIPKIHSHTNNDPYIERGSLSGQPISSFQIHRPGYSLAYDARNRNPSWVYEHLTSENIKGNAERSLEFKEDEAIPEPLSATLADYKKSGFDRGH